MRDILMIIVSTICGVGAFIWVTSMIIQVFKDIHDDNDYINFS